MKSTRLLLLLATFSLSLAQNVQITPDWSVTQIQLNIFKGGLVKYLTDNYLYHWGDLIDGLNWDAQGFIDQDQLKKNFDYTYGFHLSPTKNETGLLVLNLDQFQWPTVVVVPAGTMIYSRVWAGICFQKLPNATETEALGKIVPFIDEIPGFGFFGARATVWSAKLTQQVMSGPRAPQKYRIEMDSIKNPVLYRDLYLGGAPSKFVESQDWTDVQKHWAIIDLLQPAGAKCANILYPDDPTKAVDGAFLDKYVRAAKRAALHTVISDGWSFDFSAKNITRDLLNDIWPILSGQSGTGDMFRGDSAMFGNEGNNYTVAVSPAQYKSLYYNSYLSLKKISDLADNQTLVQIIYPDVFHINVNLLPSKLYYEITSYSQNELKANLTLARELNRKISEELFYSVISNIYSPYIPVDTKTITALASIRPFSQFNDEIIGFLLRSVTNSTSTGLNFPPSLYPFFTKIYPEMQRYQSVRNMVHLPQWRQYLDSTFGGPRMGPLNKNWDQLDQDYNMILSDWNKTYTKTDCQLVVEGKWMKFVDIKSVGWRSAQ